MMQQSLLDLPFDHYERHAVTREIAAVARGFLARASLSVLDVGGQGGSLAKFLAGDRVVALDIEAGGDASIPRGEYIRGSGSHLPFAEASFDVVACHDTLEHVPWGLRERFLSEMARVARDLVIVNGPFRDPTVEAAEGSVMEVARSTLGDDCSTVRFLTEHAVRGLPDIRVPASLLEDLGFATTIIPNGPLDEWLVKMLMKHAAGMLAPYRFQAHEFDRWSNGLFQPVSAEKPTYRHAIVAVKTAGTELLEAVRARFTASPQALENGGGPTVSFSTLAPSMKEFVWLAENRLRQLSEEVEALIVTRMELEERSKRLEGEIVAKEDALAELEALHERDQATMNDLAQQLENIRVSLGYRLLVATRGAIQFAFPPDSARGAVYRALCVAARAPVRGPTTVRSLARRGLKARGRYGTLGAVGKSIQHLTERPAVDPVEYALSVAWEPGEARGAARRPLREPAHPEVSKDRPPTVNWVVPTIGEGGGFRTIFRFVDALQTLGFRQRLYEMPVARPQRSPEELRTLVQREYGVSLREVSGRFERQEPADITLATSWHTAYPALKAREGGRKFYLVQDFEPLFLPTGTESVLAENTYRFGMYGFTAGRWLWHKLTSEYGMDCDYFDLAVDAGTYYPQREGPRRKIFFYARPATPRRGFELGVKALELFHSRNRGYQIVIAGGETPPDKIPFRVTDAGYLSEQKLNQLYNQSAAALVISLTNCSLLPLEIMATGCPVVTTLGENNQELLPGDAAIYSLPSPHHLADALEKAVRRPFRPELVDAARRYSWEEQAQKLAGILRRCLEPSAAARDARVPVA